MKLGQADEVLGRSSAQANDLRDLAISPTSLHFGECGFRVVEDGDDDNRVGMPRTEVF